MQILVKKVGQGLEEKTINSLQDMKNIVNGNIESIPLFHKICMVCNAYGKMNNLKYNFTFKEDDIVGDVFFVKLGNEEFISLDEHDINKIKSYFKYK